MLFSESIFANIFGFFIFITLLGSFSFIFWNNFLGPWAKFEDEKTVAKPDPELQKEMDEIVRKRKLKSRAGRKAAQEEQHMAEESSTLHSKFVLLSKDYYVVQTSECFYVCFCVA